ncbi:neuropeptide F [Lucilia sericata]|uniref:neuropeptide F n=1 Tax=Lucilia sericata TaxID=13632 RepID=UPI0018A7F08C|nr:neuropeptide F [Lucilia sericata]XP_037817521.1 neuropeptide F [Lucilia sericata]
MVSSMRQVLILVTIIALLACIVSANNSRPPRNNDISNMADALKYLQDLDTYYGDRARVRFGKRASLIQLLRNHLNNEAEMNHPAELAAAEEPF